MPPGPPRDAPAEPAPDAGRTPGANRPGWLLVGTAAALTLLALPLPLNPTNAWLDPSWMTALSLAHTQDVRFGEEIAFTYGPWGFLAAPQEFFLGGAVLAIAYSVATAVALYLSVLRGASRWLPVWAAAACTAVFAVFAASIEAPELGVIALAVFGLDLVAPSRLHTPLRPWVPLALGAVAALQLQVKFGVGVASAALAAIVCVSRARWLRSLSTSAASFVVSTVVLWLAAGQQLGDLVLWLRRSLAITAGYSDAMALEPVGIDRWSWLMLAVPFATVVAGCVAWLRRDRWKGLPTVVLLTWTAWYFVKQGYVRLDSLHRAYTMAAMAAIVLVVPWRVRSRPVALAVAAWSLVTILLVPGSSWGAQRQRLVDGLGQQSNVLRIGRMVVDDDFHDAELAAQRADVLSQYSLPADALDALPGTLHGDPYEVSVVWALDREWAPLPAFQTYFAWTPDLDRSNAEVLASGDAPDVIAVAAVAGGSVDDRVPQWDAPEHQLAIVCNYDVASQAGYWHLLRRRTDGRCGDAVLVDEQWVGPGESFSVPAPRHRTSLVYAEFDYPRPLVDRVVTMLLRPLEIPQVVVDGDSRRFVPDLAGHPHLVRVPAGAGPTSVPWAGTDIGSMAFPSAGGDVTVRFYEVPLRP